MSLKKLSIYLLASLLVVVNPSFAFAADSNVGNEVVDAANTSLTRTGAGTAANPYKLHLNVGNANTWTGAQTFNAAVTAAGGFTSTGTFTASGVINANNTVQANGTFNANGALNAVGAINLGDGGDAASLSGTTVTVNAGDNNANSFLVQQGTIKYLQVNTTNGSEAVSFGNTTTNPSFSFLGTGATVFGGPITASNITATGTLSANSFTTSGAVNAGSFTTTGGVTADTVTATTINIAALTSSSSITANGALTANDTFSANGNITQSGAGTFTTGTGAVTLNGNTIVAAGKTLTAAGNLAANGQSVFTPSGTNDVSVLTDADSKLVVSGLMTDTGTALCVNGSDEVVVCSSGGTPAGSLQAAYDGGNTINTTSSRDIEFVLNDTAVDSNFKVNLAGTNTAVIARANSAASGAPAQLLLLDNLDNDLTVDDGLKVTAAAGSITTALNVSDPEIVTALDAGSNNVAGTNWSISGSTGNIVTNGNLTVSGTSTLVGNTTVAGDVSVNGGDITTTATTANIFNTTATTINLGGSATVFNLGGSFGTTSINSSSIVFPNANILHAMSATLQIDSANFGGGYGSTGVTISNSGNVQANGNVTVDGSLTAASATFNPGGTDDVTVTTDADSTFVLAGLQTATGDGLCIDASNNVIKCSGTPSDVRLKKNITDLTDVLPRVLKTQGVRYDLLKDAESAPGEGKNIGFIAQELEVLFPEVVKTDANGIKSVDYEKMTAVLVESTKEQQKQIDELKAEIEALKAAIQNK